MWKKIKSDDCPLNPNKMRKDQLDKRWVWCAKRKCNK